MQNVLSRHNLINRTSAPHPLIYSVEMAGVCLNSLLLITFFTVTLSATTSGDPPDAANDRDRIDFSKPSLRDREDEYLIDYYFSQLHNKVWEVLASHGVQVEQKQSRK